MARQEMVVHQVGIAEMVVAQGNNQLITTCALGSCIGLTIYDPLIGVGGMLHFMLAQPSEGRKGVWLNPATYATEGIPALFKQAYALGAVKERLVVCATGGAEMLSKSLFAVGRRNVSMMGKMFAKAGVSIAGQDTGGNYARAMSLALADGTVTVKAMDNEVILWPKQSNA